MYPCNLVRTPLETKNIAVTPGHQGKGTGTLNIKVTVSKQRKNG